MNNNSKQINREIEKLRSKREQLNIERENAVSALNTARQGVISGESEVITLNSLQTSQIALDSLIAEIDLSIETKESELENARAAERDKQSKTDFINLDAQSESLAKELLAVKADIETRFDKAQELRRQIAEIKGKANDIFHERFPSAQATLTKHLPELEAEIEQFFEELRNDGAKLQVIRSKHWFTHLDFFLDDYSAYQPERGNYDEAFRIAMETIPPVKKNDLNTENGNSALGKLSKKIWGKKG